MPRNRQQLDRQVKADAILDAAEALLLHDGYDTATMAGIARAAGVTANAVYWYFPSKDDVLAAVLRRRLEHAVERLRISAPTAIADLVQAGLHELDAVATLTATIHERARHSAAVAEAHAAFHRVVDDLLPAALVADGLTPHDAHLAAAAIMAMVEGIHLHEAHRDPSQRDELVLWALDQFTRTHDKERTPVEGTRRRRSQTVG